MKHAWNYYVISKYTLFHFWKGHFSNKILHKIRSPRFIIQGYVEKSGLIMQRIWLLCSSKMSPKRGRKSDDVFRRADDPRFS